MRAAAQVTTGAPSGALNPALTTRAERVTPARVAALLAPRERGLVAAAVGPGATLTAFDDLAGVADALAYGTADAVLVSVACLTHDPSGRDRAGHGPAPTSALVPALARYVRDFPDATFTAIVTEVADPWRALAAAHLLGAAGVGPLLDCRSAPGWTALRQTLAPGQPMVAFHRACVAACMAATATAASACPALPRFFAAVFAPGVARARLVAARLGVHPTTLASRCLRAGLPSPRRFSGWAQVVWAAWLAEAPGRPLAAVADRLDASSLQGLNRILCRLTGMSLRQIQQRHTGADMLARYCAELVTPYRERLRTFDPLGGLEVRSQPGRPRASQPDGLAA